MYCTCTCAYMYTYSYIVHVHVDLDSTSGFYTPPPPPMLVRLTGVRDPEQQHPASVGLLLHRVNERSPCHIVGGGVTAKGDGRDGDHMLPWRQLVAMENCVGEGDTHIQ